MKDNALYEQLQSLQKNEAETLVRDLEIELMEPETKRSKSGRDVTYLNWRYRDPSNENADWKARSTPIFTDEAKMLLSQGPYEQGKLYRVTARKDQNNYWKWSCIDNTNLQEQRTAQMQAFKEQRQYQSLVQNGHSQEMSQSHEPQR